MFVCRTACKPLGGGDEQVVGCEDRPNSDIRKQAQYGDGKGLWLQVSAFGTRSWLLRYIVAGRARVMGLGPYPEVSLKEARDRAAEARRQIRGRGRPD